MSVGTVAEMLLSNGMDAMSLRTFDILTASEWHEVDKAVYEAASQVFVGVTDLMSRGLKHDVANALALSVFKEGDALGERDCGEYNVNYLPLAYTYKDIFISSRDVIAARKLLVPIETYKFARASRVVAGTIENTLFNGDGKSVGDFGIYGYTSFPDRTTMSMRVQWTDPSATAETIFGDVLAMRGESKAQNHHGPWMFYVPEGYYSKLHEDVKPVNGEWKGGHNPDFDKSILDRVSEIEGIEDVKVSDKLADHNVVLVEMQLETARMVVGLQPIAVEWPTEEGTNFRVLSVMVPQIRSDQNHNCGIVHLYG